MTTGAELHRRKAHVWLGRRILGKAAFTIAETMIFLAVSSLIFIAFSRTIAGKQASAEFTDSVIDYESRLQDIANDVSTGYYLRTGSFTCVVSVATVTITAPNQAQGTNDDCISIGELIYFPTALPTEQYTINNLAGRKKTTGSAIKNVSTIAEATPVVNNRAEVTENLTLGTVVSKITYNDGTDHNVSGFAFVTTFGNGGSGSLSSSDIRANIVPVTSKSPFVMAPVTNPINGVTLCLQPGAAAQKHANITVGGNGSQVSTKVVFGNGPCS